MNIARGLRVQTKVGHNLRSTVVAIYGGNDVDHMLVVLKLDEADFSGNLHIARSRKEILNLWEEVPPKRWESGHRYRCIIGDSGGTIQYMCRWVDKKGFAELVWIGDGAIEKTGIVDAKERPRYRDEAGEE